MFTIIGVKRSTFMVEKNKSTGLLWKICENFKNKV